MYVGTIAHQIKRFSINLCHVNGKSLCHVICLYRTVEQMWFINAENCTVQLYRAMFVFYSRSEPAFRRMSPNPCMKYQITRYRSRHEYQTLHRIQRTTYSG